MTHRHAAPRPALAALRRVLAAPYLVLGLSAIHLALAFAISIPVRAAFRAAMGPFFHDAPQRLLAPLFELMGQQRAAPATVSAALIVAAVVAVLVGPLLAGAAIQRLAAPCKLADQARAAAQFYPSAVVQGVYGVVLRLLLLLVAAAIGSVHDVVQVVLTVVAFTFGAAVVDLARARVVLTGARPFHPKTFIRATVAVAQDPRLLLRSSAASLLHAGILAATAWTAIHGFGAPWAPWAARGLALAAMFAALWRLAVAVDHTARPNA